MPTTKYTFNVILDSAEKQHLSQIAAKLKSSRGAVVRRLIDAAYAHSVLELATCADGGRCFVPGVHARPPAAPVAPQTS